MRLRDLPNPQIYTRQERYRARPPRVLEASGFHTRNSLAVYQGLVYYLLWLHSKYYKVGVRRPVGPGPVETGWRRLGKPAWLEERARRVEQSGAALESLRLSGGRLRTMSRALKHGFQDVVLG